MIPPPAPVLHLPILSNPATTSRRGSPHTPVSVAASSPRRKWRLSQLRSSLPPEGAPAELVGEDSKFVPLNAEDPMYGPPAILLIGFEKGETGKIQEFLKELDGDFLKIAKSPQRICIFSGLTGEEMMMFINAFPETGLEQAAFAALVPNSAEKVLGEVIEEIMGDHEMLTGRNSS